MRRVISASSPPLLALLGGVLVAIGIPPLAIWPSMMLGIACYVIATQSATPSNRRSFVLGACFAWGWFAPGLGWMWHLVPGGFVIAPLIFAVMHGVAAIIAHHVAPRATTTLTQRIVALALAHTLAECLRFVAPFGGVPLANLALGIADTRLASPVRIVGPLGVSLWIFLTAGAAAELWIHRRTFGWRTRRGAFGVLGVLAVAQIAGLIAPSGTGTGDSLRIAAIQGGGPQGVLAIYSDPRAVTERHLSATRLVEDGATVAAQVDLVLWPENTVDVNDLSTSRVLDEIAHEARRIGAPIAVGVTEDAGANFTNAHVVVDASGNELSRYDKVRRVPYGEYVPLRGVLRTLGAPVDRIPRDAVAGTTPAIIRVPKESDTVPLAVAISWEVFFSGRVADGVNAGGQVVLNPTNGSSYTGEILQQQQVATSQLRALESGRWVVQAATTGYSMFVDHDGHVLDIIPIGKQGAIIRDVPLRTGRTIYSHLGDDLVALALVVALLACAWRFRKKSEALA